MAISILESYYTLIGFKYKSAVQSYCTFKDVSRKHTFLAIYNGVLNQKARYFR